MQMPRSLRELVMTNGRVVVRMNRTGEIACPTLNPRFARMLSPEACPERSRRIGCATHALQVPRPLRELVMTNGRVVVA
jgi:hypothetical protein